MQPLRFAQFTDLHLYGATDSRLRGLDVYVALQTTLAIAAARHAPWDGTLLTGDLVQDDAAGYEHVRALFGASRTPVHCLPGNHDVPEAMRDALAAPPFTLDAAAVHGDWLLVMLDSCVPGSASGRLAPAELARLDAALGAHPQRHALVCLHHHPVPMASRWLDTVGLANSVDLFDVLDRHPQVRGLLWGHVHQAFDDERRGVRLMGTPSTCVQFEPRSARFALDTRPPAYRMLTLHADGRIEAAIEWLPEAAAAAGDHGRRTATR